MTHDPAASPPVDHPWLGPLVPLDTWLTPPPPERMASPAPRSGWWARWRQGALHDRQEPGFRPGNSVENDEDGPMDRPWTLSWAEQNRRQAQRLNRVLHRFFTTPLRPERPVLAMWWGVTHDESVYTSSGTLPMAVTSERTLAWMIRPLGGDTVPLAAQPLFEFDDRDWNEHWLSSVPPESPTPFADRVGVWVARTATQTVWGVGSIRLCLDHAHHTVTKTHWTASEGWVEVTLVRNDWSLLMGLVGDLSKHRVLKGWNNPSLSRAVHATSLPDHQDWTDPSPRAWVMVPVVAPDHAYSFSHPLPLGMDADGWKTVALAHANEWNAHADLLQQRLRRLIKVARRDPGIDAWARWLWSNPAAKTDRSGMIRNGWSHRHAWNILRHENPALAEWAKLLAHGGMDGTVWSGGLAGSDAVMGNTVFEHAWITAAGRRWARRQTAPAVRQWLRLVHGCKRSHLHAWHELLARWDVPRLPGWAIRALRTNDALRHSVVPVLIELLVDVAQPSREQCLLMNTLQAHRTNGPTPQGLRHLLHAWVRDVVQRPWAERRRDNPQDPMDRAAWDLAFSRAGTEVPVGHERWTWSRWKHWLTRQDEWASWLQRNDAPVGGLRIEQDGWRVVALLPAAARPSLYPVPDLFDDAPITGDASVDNTDPPGINALLSTLANTEDDEDGPFLEAWSVLDPAGTSWDVVLFRQPAHRWAMDPARTAPTARAFGEHWAQARTLLETTMHVHATNGPGSSRPMLDPHRLLPAFAPLPVSATTLPSAVPPALGALHLNGWSILPVTRTDELGELGHLMANCVGTHGYDVQMAMGLCRLFVVQGLASPVLVDLRYDPSEGGWYMHQVESYDNGRANLDLVLAMNAFADLYTLLCPQGHLALPTAASPVPNGFDADTATHLHGLAGELVDDALGRGRALPGTIAETYQASEAGHQARDGEGATDPFDANGDVAENTPDLADRIADLMPVDLPDLETSATLSPFAIHPQDPEGLVNLLVSLMPDSETPPLAQSPSKYQRGVSVLLDEALDQALADLDLAPGDPLPGLPDAFSFALLVAFLREHRHARAQGEEGGPGRATLG